MSWTCSSSTNTGLVDNLVRASILHTTRIATVLRLVDRARFVVDPQDAYRDAPSYLGLGATISAPHMHCFALEALESRLKPGANVMDIGCGSGYLLEVFARLVPTGQVLGIDHLPGLTALTQSNLESSSSAVPGNINVRCSDGRLGSAPEDTPKEGWDVIHVGAAAPVMPHKLVEQLARGGAMFIPVGEGTQHVWLVEKDKEDIVTERNLFPVRYVPLTNAEEQLASS